MGKIVVIIIYFGVKNLILYSMSVYNIIIGIFRINGIFIIGLYIIGILKVMGLLILN